jgi:hypothetical protein
MNVMKGLAACLPLVFSLPVLAASSAEYALILANTDESSGRINSGLKINSATDNPATLGKVRFYRVRNIAPSATEVDIVISYRDASGAVHVTSTGAFEEGCRARAAADGDGVDVICPVVTADPR